MAFARGILFGALALGLANAQAALHDRGGGLIFDDVLNLTWLQDANYARTSGYDADGRMLWDEAKVWANDLSYSDTVRNVTWDDWRLPTVRPANGSVFNLAYSPFGDTDIGTNITSPAAEMSYMFYVNLGNQGKFTPAGAETGCAPCLQHVGPFVNLQPNDVYWYGTELNRPNQLPGAFNFYMALGNQGASGNLAEHNEFSWAVRDGDVAAVPEPGTLEMMIAGLGLLAISARRRRRR